MKFKIRGRRSEVGDQGSSLCGLQSAVFSLQSSVSSRAGFTLLELMTVMVIMFILMGMSTLALRGVMRGAGISGAVSNTKAVLTQARQYAIMNQRPTAVIFRKQGETNTMTVVTRYGKVHSGGANDITVVDDLPWTSAELSTNATAVYNFKGDQGIFVPDQNPDQRKTFTTRGLVWIADDEVAFAVGAERALPVGMEFGTLPSPPVVVFNADGSAREKAKVGLREKNVVKDGLQVWSAGEDGKDGTEDDVRSWRQSQ